ncbi:MAG TPA: phosphoribosyltransferase family protein [Acidobacteriaceae bacterium]|nr:phosphoribosyltransferase family protein [Acidobacteriaceae bacterium]
MVIIFHDRRQAGQALAQIIRDEWSDAISRDEPIVLGLPRGGVPVAFEIARALRLPLDVFVVRKLGAPGQEELAMGAVASGGGIVLQGDVVRSLQISAETIDAAVARERIEIERREAAYRDSRPPLRLQNRAVILVDDGLATGATMKAAARALRPLARRILVAVPVAASGTCEELRREVDRLVCVESPEPFHAVGEFYRNFDQVTDEEVRVLLAQAGSPDEPAARRALS